MGNGTKTETNQQWTVDGSGMKAARAGWGPRQWGWGGQRLCRGRKRQEQTEPRTELCEQELCVHRPRSPAESNLAHIMLAWAWPRPWGGDLYAPEASCLIRGALGQLERTNVPAVGALGLSRPEGRRQVSPEGSQLCPGDGVPPKHP